MNYELNLFQIGFICFITILMTILLIVIFEPKLYVTERKNFITRTLNAFWMLGAIFLIYVLISLTPILPKFLIIEDNKTILLSSVGIILSAFIASLSVMKNIQSAKDLKQEEIRLNNIKNLSYLVFLLNSMEKDLDDIVFIINNMDSKAYVLKEAVNSYISLKKELLNKDIIFLLDDKEQGDLKGLLVSSENIETFYNKYFDGENRLYDISPFYIDNMKILKDYIQKIARNIKIKASKM
ncbi:hypothetical protein [Aliarcobacter butzleri]|uniref:hypothetical protein n=1 Tax=Aliarcobacter butzleri TaxID=28197 RepID=UPI002875A7C0|nr:hypothetical protein [Aliarcobacter butzleri]MDS1315781.1 hypothetical protein [Aliarcobacter butzleri]